MKGNFININYKENKKIRTYILYVLICLYIFKLFDSCKDLRPSWICFTGYFLINRVENIEEYEKRVLNNFTTSYVSLRPYSREESRALGNFMYKEWRKNNYDKILDI